MHSEIELPQYNVIGICRLLQLERVILMVFSDSSIPVQSPVIMQQGVPSWYSMVMLLFSRSKPADCTKAVILLFFVRTVSQLYVKFI